MAYQQLAKLFVRGRLMSETLKGLSGEEREELEREVVEAVEDPELRGMRNAFCSALARTLRNEYVDREVGLQDMRVAVMRAVLAARHGPQACEGLVSDPVQRRKWIKTWVFGYLKQVLRENRLPAVRRSVWATVSASLAAAMGVRDALEEVAGAEQGWLRRSLLQAVKESSIEEVEDGHVLLVDHWSFPGSAGELVGRVGDGIDGVSVECVVDGFSCTGPGWFRSVRAVLRSVVPVRSASFDVDEPDGLIREASMVAHCEENRVEVDDALGSVRGRLPDAALPVLEILVEETRPEEYVERYGRSEPRLSHMAEFLGMSVAQVKRWRSAIRIYGMVAGLVGQR